MNEDQIMKLIEDTRVKAKAEALAVVKAQLEKAAKGHDELAAEASGFYDGSKDRAKAEALRRFSDVYLP